MKKQFSLGQRARIGLRVGLVAWLAGTLVACSSTTESARPMPMAPAGPERWVYNEAISDEFDGTSLDTTKWFDHNPT